MDNKYRLVRVYMDTTSNVYTLDDRGRELEKLTSFDGGEEFYYAIYEHEEVGDYWSEYDYFEQDFEKAKEAYFKLTERSVDNEA